MSAIQSALKGLNTKLQKLEAVVESHEEIVAERAVKEKQQDLFNGEVPRNGSARHSIDPAVLASKLDNAIDQVEQILREG